MAGEAKVTGNTSLRIAGLTIGGVDEQLLCDYQQALQETIPNPTTDRPVAFAVTVLNIRAVGLHATQTLTLKTYSGSSLVDTITLTKNVAQLWTVNRPAAQAIFTGDFDSIKVTNASGNDATLQVGVGLQNDPLSTA